jgi:hypothetical protein
MSGVKGDLDQAITTRRSSWMAGSPARSLAAVSPIKPRARRTRRGPISKRRSKGRRSYVDGEEQKALAQEVLASL